MCSTMRLIFNLYSTFNALFNFQLRIQHSTIHYIFNSFFTHSITVSIQQFQPFIQHSTLIFKTFNYSFNSFGPSLLLVSDTDHCLLKTWRRRLVMSAILFCLFGSTQTLASQLDRSTPLVSTP